MESENGLNRKRFQKRRRKNIDGKVIRVNVSMSEVERAALYRIELETGRTASEILVSSALSSEYGSPVDRRALASSLLQLRYELSSVGNNLNQVARHANSTGELQPEIHDLVAEIKQQLNTINEALEELE